MTKHITPADETAITVEKRGEWMTLVTLERGNGDSVQTMELTPQERYMLGGMLGNNLAASTHAVFKAIDPSIPLAVGRGGAG